MSPVPRFTADVLAIDAAEVAGQIAATVFDLVIRKLRRKGVVLGLSGGIDSSVAAALCARALGPERVLPLLMPEADSSPDSTRLGRLVARTLGIVPVLEDIEPILRASGCYRRRDDAIRAVVPEYDVPYAPTDPLDQDCLTSQSTTAYASRTSWGPYSTGRVPKDAPLPRASTFTTA